MHFLKLNDLNANQIQQLLSRSQVLAGEFEARACVQTLSGKRIALINDDTGWRNTSALELGTQSLGATVVSLPVILGSYEDIADLALYVANWFDLVAVRTSSLVKLEQLAQASTIPIVNLRTSSNHPCETLGDLSYILSLKQRLEPLHVVAVAPAANIIHSWAEAALVLPISLTQITPHGFDVDLGEYPSADIKIARDLELLEEADVIITDCWPKSADRTALLSLQITSDHLNSTKPECLFIPCPPVTRGEEVSADAMTHGKCVVLDAKAHLLHAQNALLEFLLGVEI